MILAVSHKSDGTERLVRFNVSKGKLQTLKKLPTTPSASYGSVNWFISAVYGSNVYLTRFEYFGNPQVKTYAYNLSTKTIKGVKSNCEILARSGKYFLATNSAADTATHRITLYKTNSNGAMISVKTLGKYITKACFLTGYVYYAKYPENSLSTTATIYRCKKSGAGTEKLATIKPTKNSNGYYGNINVNKITANYCEYRDGDKGSYRYYYSSKRKVKI